MPGSYRAPESDYNSAKPAGSDKGYDADDLIRANFSHIDNCLLIEHYAPSNDPDASEDDFGRHDFITLKEQASKPDLSGSTNRIAIYPKSDGLYIEKEDGSEVKILDYTTDHGIDTDIPAGEKILFYKDTAVAGYSLVAVTNDRLVYVSPGSAAGGDAGGAAKSGGTWQQPGHALTVAEMPAHTHEETILVNQWGAATNNPTGGTGSPSGTMTTTSAGGGAAHNHGATWRPPGYVYTLQQRS